MIPSDNDDEEDCKPFLQPDSWERAARDQRIQPAVSQFLFSQLAHQDSPTKLSQK